MPARTTARAPTLVAIGLLIAFAAQCLGAMRLKSATYDEPVYMAAGHTALTTGIDLNPAHPPLMKYLIALPLVLVGASPASALPNWNRMVEIKATSGLGFLFANRVDADTLLFAARSSVVCVALLLGALVFFWTRRLYGPWAAVVALGLYAFNPDVIAHATLASLDLGLAGGVAFASYALWRAYERPSIAAGLLAGLALGSAFLVKSPALLLLAFLPIELGAAIVRARRADARGAASRTTALLTTTAVALVTALCLIAVAYGPHRFGLAEYVASLRVGLFEREQFMSQRYQFFCWGRYSKTGFWWYFLAAFLVKAPIPMLLATPATIVWLVRRRPGMRFAELFLVLPVVGFFVATAFVKDAMGIRYLLPVYPLLFVMIGGMSVDAWRAAQRVAARSPVARGLATGTAALLVAVYAGGTLWIYPDHLAFFNGLFCGPGQGIRYLDDSNIDIGQDFKQLSIYLREHGIQRVRGVYNPMRFAEFVISYYRAPFEWMTLDEIGTPRPGWYAVSAHLLQRPALSKERPDVRFDWLDRYEPVAKIGWSIYLYRFD